MYLDTQIIWIDPWLYTCNVSINMSYVNNGFAIQCKLAATEFEGFAFGVNLRFALWAGSPHTDIMSDRARIKEQRESLPTFEYRKELIDAIREYNVLVIIGETGRLRVCEISNAEKANATKDLVKQHRSLNTSLRTCQKSKRLAWHNQGTLAICCNKVCLLNEIISWY